jgi:hypothetical protein
MDSLAFTTHESLAGLAEEYASAVVARQALVAATRKRLAEVAAEMAPALREAIGAERGCRLALEQAVSCAPHLFDRPRTRVTHGIRYGWRTTSAVIEIPDEAATVAKIERLLPEEQQALLLRRTVRVHKPAVLDLTAADLRRLGIRQVPGEDGVIVKPLADDTDRLVDALLADAEEAAHE